MAQQQQRDGSGVLFKNDKDGKESRPDYKGSIRIGGVDYWLSAWIKQGERGKFMSLAAEPKQEQRAAVVSKPQRRAPQPEDFQDVPF